MRAYYRILRRVLLLIVLLIVYGSLYPWRFAIPHLAANPITVLLHSWPSLGLRYSVRDIVVNISLYIPLGFAAHVVFRKSAWPGLGIYGPVLLGLLLSASMELLQLLEPVRNTSMVDLVTNVTGSALGVIAGALFEVVAAGHPTAPALEWKVVDRAALILVFCWIAWVFFPFFPALTTHALAFKLRAFVESSPLDVRGVISAAAAWYAAGLLFTGAGLPYSRRAVVAALLAIPAQFFIVDKQPVESQLAGAIVGVVMFLLFHRGGPPAASEAWAFLAVVVLRGLAPFHFTRAAPFGWTPFGATLDSDWQTGGAILIEKIFYYGTAIWLLQRAGFGRARSTVIVVAVLAAIELVQTHLPGRTPEITDPLLALWLGVALAGLARSTPPSRA